MRLRKALGSSIIETVAGGYRLAVAGDDVDVARLEDLIERGRGLELWRGDPFGDLDRWPPGRSEAARSDLNSARHTDRCSRAVAAGR
jgi:hypothetical protein